MACIPFSMAALLLTVTLLTLECSALMYDVITPEMRPPTVCSLGCAKWTNLLSDFNTASQVRVDSLWADSTTESAAGRSCAMPANFTGSPASAVMGPDGPLAFDFSFGPQCYCVGTAVAPTSAFGYCTDPELPSPQQVNLQYGKDETEFVASFITLEGGSAPIGAPTVELCGPNVAQCVNVSGTSHTFLEPQDTLRVYTMHLVPLADLPFGSSFTYRVRSGHPSGVWSAQLTFVTRPAAGPMAFTIVGDLGNYIFNCMGNLLDDVAQGRSSFFVHLGDHAYNMAMGNGSRGDGYMTGLQPILSSIPWLPVIGNHELEGSPFGAYCAEEEHCEYRYLNQTSGLLRTASASGSDTNRYYSLDIGLVHFVVLDYNPYIDVEGSDVSDAQLAWLAKDLAVASTPSRRAAVPWIWIAAHVPMYSSGADSEAATPSLMTDIEPLMMQYGVDLHTVGHEHFYESMWPVGPNGAVPSRSFVSPAAPVHVTTGAGGAPAFSPFNAPAQFTRKQVQRWSYSRVTVWNATVLTWQQVDNLNATILDEWTIVQKYHGPFGHSGGSQA